MNYYAVKSQMLCVVFVSMNIMIKLFQIYIKTGNKYYRRILVIIEEHISLIQESRSIYLGHVSQSAGSAAETKRSIANFFSVNSISLNNLVSIGCDGTNVNIGRKKV